jgi:hypothetical protein
MFRALSLAAAQGDDVAKKLRSRISMAGRAGMDSDLVADAILETLARHIDHGDGCPYRHAATTTIEQLINIGLTDAETHANRNEINTRRNHKGRPR